MDETTAEGTAPAPGAGLLPDLTPDMNAPGMGALFTFGDYLAAYALWACLAAVLIGALMIALGPRLGFSQAKAMGMGGVIGGILLAGLVAISTDAVNVTFNQFSAA